MHLYRCWLLAKMSYKLQTLYMVLERSQGLVLHLLLLQIVKLNLKKSLLSFHLQRENEN
jgi:hypothetical protein